ncbi:hypothetical protein CJ030_MR5G017344 [Morella rubra]|uniref:Uncharacterized protein n=1 Tax=Morella rubra TaxID=262757 RepID=A0A6A1VMH3_9ROSI|nr:hypothetical protein CJ030_MR5G017344 [Morella rubra]
MNSQAGIGNKRVGKFTAVHKAGDLSSILFSIRFANQFGVTFDTVKVLFK